MTCTQIRTKTPIERILEWAPSYPWAFSAPQACRALNIPPDKISGYLHKAAKYEIVEKVGVYENIAYWRVLPPEGTPYEEPCYHKEDPHAKPTYFYSSKLRAWVESLPSGTRFSSRDVAEVLPSSRGHSISGYLRDMSDLVECLGKAHASNKFYYWRKL